MIIFSLACWGSSLFIPPTGQGAPDLVIQRNVVASTVSLLNHLRDDKRIWWGAFVTSWFWLAGAVVATVMQPLVKDLGGTEEVITTCNAIFAIAIAIGSGLAAWLAAGRIILLPTLIAAFFLGVFALGIGISTFGGEPIPDLNGYWALFGSWRGIFFVI